MNMKGPGDFTPDDDDDRVSVRAEELCGVIAEDRQAVLLLDAEASEGLAGEQYERAFTLLADLDGKHPADLLGSDLLADLYRLAGELAAIRETAIANHAQAMAEREAEDWPVWRGSASATRHRAQIEGDALARAEAGE